MSANHRVWTLCAVLVCAAQFIPPVAGDALGQIRRVNAPYFTDTVRASETAVFWFGRVDVSRNYTDVRVGYTPTELWIRLSTFDQWLWLDEASSRTPASLETWDAATILLDTTGLAPGVPAAGSYRLVGELSSWRPRTDYQAAYVGTGSAWARNEGLSFTTETTWRGDSPNNSQPDRGWTITFRIPFSSLGLSGPPSAGTLWSLGVITHDRDSAAGPAASEQWPESLNRDRPVTWGDLAFGLRPLQVYPAPPDAVTYVVRHGENGTVVTDAMVGGGSTCGEGLSFFEQWGSANYAGSTHLVVQNQGDVADWPCFSKFYLDFPLTALPAGGAVAAARLTLHQFGGSDPTQALRSLVQVFTVSEPWDEAGITWNTAPLAVENVARSWVDPIPAPGLPWPGAARTFDLTWAVSDAYAAGRDRLRLVVYAADGAYHSGKYFTASETGAWNATGRPTLEVVLGSGIALPGAPRNFRVVPD